MFFSIFRIILINKNQQKYVMSRNLQQTTSGKRASSGAHRLDILRTFFHQSVDVIEDYSVENDADTTTSTDESYVCDESGASTTALTINCLESYWCSDYHKCHSYCLDDNIICILYVSSIPTHSMRFELKTILFIFFIIVLIKYFYLFLYFRLMTQKTLKSILSEKDIVW